MRYTLDGRTFKTKTDLLAECSRVLRGGRIEDSDARLLLGVLRLHRHAGEKIGAGVKRFYVGSDDFGGRCFWLERLDGSTTDWSFHAALKTPTKRQEALSALRTAVVDQIHEFRDAAFRAGAPRCELTGAQLSRTTCHVDHATPFIDLAEAFASTFGGLGSIATQPTADGETLTLLADQKVWREWREYHRQHARLRLTTPQANLSRPRK